MAPMPDEGDGFGPAEVIISRRDDTAPRVLFATSATYTVAREGQSPRPEWVPSLRSILNLPGRLVNPGRQMCRCHLVLRDGRSRASAPHKSSKAFASEQR